MTGMQAPPAWLERQGPLLSGPLAPGEARARVLAAVADRGGGPAGEGAALLLAGALAASVAGRAPERSALPGAGYASGRLRAGARDPGPAARAGRPDLRLAAVALIAQDRGTCQASAVTAAYFTLAQPGLLPAVPG